MMVPTIWAPVPIVADPEPPVPTTQKTLDASAPPVRTTLPLMVSELPTWEDPDGIRGAVERESFANVHQHAT